MLINIYNLLGNTQNRRDLTFRFADQVEPDHFFLALGERVINVPFEFSAELVQIDMQELFGLGRIIRRLFVGYRLQKQSIDCDLREFEFLSFHQSRLSGDQ